MSQLAVCAIIFTLFYERDRQGEVFKVMTNASFFSAFSRLGSFSQVFGKVKEWLILELHEIIRVPHLVSCLAGFNFLCDRVH